MGSEDITSGLGWCVARGKRHVLDALLRSCLAIRPSRFILAKVPGRGLSFKHSLGTCRGYGRGFVAFHRPEGFVERNGTNPDPGRPGQRTVARAEEGVANGPKKNRGPF